MSEFVKSEAGIILPKKNLVGVHCYYCPQIIYKDREAKGRLWLVKGKPACAKCRILNGRFGSIIKRDKKNYEEDLQKRENFKVQKVALASQDKAQVYKK